MEVMQFISKNSPKGFQAIADAALEVNGRGLLEIARRYGNITQAEAKGGGLDKKLAVKHKVVGVAFPGEGFEYFSRISPQAAVPLPQVLSHHEVFNNRERSVG